MKSILYQLLIISLCALIFSNCKKTTDKQPQPPPVTDTSVSKPINNNVIIIDSTNLILNNDSTLINAGKYEFSYNNTAPNIKANDVIVGATNGGYIRKVSSVNKQSNKITLETSQGSMEDVFRDTGFNIQTTIEGLKSERTMSGYQFDVSGTTIYQDDNLTIKLDKGIINTDGDWNFGFNYKDSKLDTFEMSCKNASFKGQFDLNISASKSTTIAEKTFVLARVAKYNTFFIAEVPVVLYTEVELRCVFSASIDASSEGTYTVNTNNIANVGIKYQNSQWQNLFTNKSNSSLSVNKGSSNVNAQIKMGIVPYISFRLYRIIGPYFSSGLQESIKGSITTPSLDWDFNTSAWLQTTAGVRAKILGNSLFDFNKDWNTDSLQYKTPYSITKVSGDNQTGPKDEYLSQTIKVRVVDNNNNPQSNAPVNFKVTAGKGSVKNARVLTDKDGYAEVFWKLGSEFGIQTVTASARKADGSFIENAPLEFAATISQKLPIVTTAAPSSITQMTAISGGNITDDGGSSIIARGICWSTTANPTVTNYKTMDGTGKGNFTSNLSGLTANTTYYVRAYATNSSGTAYGNAQSFTTANTETGDSTFTDPRDGQVYTFKHIGSQVWMTKNLDYVAADSKCYGDNTGNCSLYGRLYDWTTALTIVPQGWHLPSKDEWITLQMFVGNNAASLMDTVSWTAISFTPTNQSGFSALAGGAFQQSQVYNYIGNGIYFWSSTRNDSPYESFAWKFILGGNGCYTEYNGLISAEDNGKEIKDYYYVRCIRNY